MGKIRTRAGNRDGFFRRNTQEVDGGINLLFLDRDKRSRYLIACYNRIQPTQAEITALVTW